MAAPDMAASWMAAPGISACWMATFCWWSIYWLWASQKLTLQQNSLRRNCMSEQLSGLLIHAAGTPRWILRPVKVSTSSSSTATSFDYLPFLIVQASSFLIYPSLLTQSVKLPLVTLQDTMSCQRSPHASQPTFT